jgi:Ca2+-binding EF-hand superfamily protein
MTKSINYAISRDEIVEMFRLIDSNNSESIEAAEIQKLLKGEISM